MPFGSVTLRPGVNVEKTPTLNEAAVSQSSFIRYRDSLIQKLGGWTRFFNTTVPGVPRDLHAWQDLNGTDHLEVGTTTQLAIITEGQYQDITPQTVSTNPTPNFTTTIGSPVVTIVDAGIANVTIYDAVLFNTPVAVGGLIIDDVYQITQISGATSYQITASSSATASISNGGAVPLFTTVSGSAVVTVTLAAHGLSQGEVAVFQTSTTGNGVTIFGAYTAATIVDVDNFTITAGDAANASSGLSMNSGNVAIVYYIAIGPAAVGAGYGLGGYGIGGYGTGTVNTSQTGTPITATDWTSDNWGQILLACPEGGGVYQFDPTGGFGNAQLITTAPPLNQGIFVSVSQQILACWGSTVREGVGIEQDPLLMKWSDVEDFTNFTTTATNQAGSFRIPIGSRIVGAGAVSNQDYVWTDLDLWAMNYVGFPNVFGFNRIGIGAGLISAHAWMALRGGIFWMGPSNFYSFGGGSGVSVIPCPVWDFVFQNLDLDNVYKIRAMPNTPFNEVGWEFPSLASSGENDSYVKFNITEPGAPWDYGALDRSAGIDQTVLGPPIRASSSGIIYQHETSNDADGQPLVWSITTGYFYFAEGEDFVFVDQILPDFIFGTYAGAKGAQVSILINVINYTGDTPVTYGPYTATAATQYITTRLRGRQASFTIGGSDLGSFVRFGRLRYRWAPAGRR